jgi:hypothetical protein
MRAQFVFSALLAIFFALPYGQIADISHLGQIHTSRRETKRKTLSVESQNSTVSANAAIYPDAPIVSVLNVLALQIHCEDISLYCDVTAPVSTPPPRA